MSVTTICRDLSALAPAAQAACSLFMAKCKTKGLNVLITETYRSQERQNYLYGQGRTRPGNKVTWTKSSRHTSRRAWDICKNVKGQEFSDAGFFRACGDIAKELGITWGGTWSTPDTPHFEISTSWKVPNMEEEIDMEELKRLQEENNYLKQVVDSLADRITKLEHPMIYGYVDQNMPEWARPTIRKLKDKGLLKGDENGVLRLTDDMLTLFVVNDRAGLYD